MKPACIAIVLALCGAPALAEQQPGIVILDPIATTEIESWSDASSHDVECRELSDLPNTFFCLTRTDALLTALMGRISYFKEATPRDQILSPDDPTFLASDQAHYVGHDTMAKAMSAFYAQAMAKCPQAEALCVTPLEQALFDTVVKPLQARNVDDFAVLAVTARADGLMSNVTHETLHARYYLDPRYRAAATAFWNERVSPDDREKIRAFLADTYNFEGPEGQALLVNEFQAYTLEQDADKDVSGFARIEKAYGEQLRQVLGLKP